MIRQENWRPPGWERTVTCLITDLLLEVRTGLRESIEELVSELLDAYISSDDFEAEVKAWASEAGWAPPN